MPRAIAAAAEGLVRNLRWAFRSLRRDPLPTLAAAATIALGVGLNTAVFSVADAVLWKPLPYKDPDRLVVITGLQRTGTGPGTFSTWAAVTCDGLRRRTTTLEMLAAYRPFDVELSGRGEPIHVPALEVSPDFFATLGVAPALGRPFLDGAAAVDDEYSAIVSDRFWRSQLGADPAILGDSVIIDGQARTVVGILPRDLRFRPVVSNGPLPASDVFLPLRTSADALTCASFFLLGRLRAGATEPQAEAELTSLLADRSLIPTGTVTAAGRLDPQSPIVVRTPRLQHYGVGPARAHLLMLLGAVSFVLLIACVNVAGLQLARLAARQNELAIRMALGAGRRRLLRQLLTEAIMLAIAGAAAGLLLAHAALRLTLPLVPPALLSGTESVAIDVRVAAYGLALALVTALLVGLLPACSAGGITLDERLALNAGGARTIGSRQGERLRTWLVTSQIAMATVLLAGAGVLIHSFVRLASTGTGFVSQGPAGVVQTVRVELPERLYPAPEHIRTFVRTVGERIRHLPGVASASVINSAPFGRMFIQGAFEVEGRPPSMTSPGLPKIEPGYFETMGIPLLGGRDFTADDAAGAPAVAIVSERVAREYFPDDPADMLGRRVRVGVMAPEGEWRTVVGVAADIRQMGLDQDVKPMIYTPFVQEREDPFLLRFVSFVVRTAAPDLAAARIRAEIRRAAPDLPIAGIATMDEAIAASIAVPRFRTVLLGLFAVGAMSIATFGLYGLMAHGVAQRRREFGVRLALGATTGDVQRLVLGRAIRIVAGGVVVGLLAAVGLTQVLRRFLFGVTPVDPPVLAAVVLLLLGVGLLAAWLPARRATRIAPWTALRGD